MTSYIPLTDIIENCNKVMKQTEFTLSFDVMTTSISVV